LAGRVRCNIGKTKVGFEKFNFFIIMVEGYCVKCKAKKEMVDAKEITMKGKGGVQRKAMTGKCPTCGTKMFRIMGKA
jgi:Zn finger protein HypA/HybF involved in hydrogenase expression